LIAVSAVFVTAANQRGGLIATAAEAVAVAVAIPVAVAVAVAVAITVAIPASATFCGLTTAHSGGSCYQGDSE